MGLITRKIHNGRTTEELIALLGAVASAILAALFMGPVLILEPVKPVAAYLTATGHITAGLALLLAGEMLKIVLIERLFCISRDKLMSIAAFAWCYDRLLQAREWMESLKAWQLTRRLSFVARRAVRRYVLELKEPEKQQRPSWQSR